MLGVLTREKKSTLEVLRLKGNPGRGKDKGKLKYLKKTSKRVGEGTLSERIRGNSH